MTIEQAIEQYDGYANVCKYHNLTVSQKEFEQIAAWLRELQERRKEPEIITCGECRYFEDSDLSGYCNNPETYAIKTDADFGCILGERRTDD